MSDSVQNSDAEDEEAFAMESYSVQGGPPEGGEHIDESGVRHVSAAQRLTTEDLDPRMDFQPPKALQVNNDGKSHTGPKGVLADYEEAKRNLRTQRMMERIAQERAVQRLAAGAEKLEVVDDQKEKAKKEKKKEKGEDEESEDSDLEDDEEVLKAYRQQCVQAVQASLPVFGEHRRLSLDEFAALVKNVHELVYVVCLLYQNHVEACVRVNFAFEELARQFRHVCFCRVRSDEAIAGFSDVGLPALIVYQGGDMKYQFVRFTDGMESISDRNVAVFLRDKGLLRTPTGMAEPKPRKAEEE